MDIREEKRSFKEVALLKNGCQEKNREEQMGEGSNFSLFNFCFGAEQRRRGKKWIWKEVDGREE
jgi:hypothetical protein